MPKVSKITGPPGTGKTTYLLRQIEAACRKYEPEKIGAVSFTKAAVTEMRSRVSGSLGISGGAARNIRTVHSHAYRLLGLSKEDIVKEDSKHIKDWNEAFPGWRLPMTGGIDDLEDGESLEANGYTEQDNKKRFQRMNIHRGRRIPAGQWNDPEAESFYKDWSTFLRENDLMDFTMILEEVLRLQYRPDIDVLFMDECQDMSRLQIDVAKMWAEFCEAVIWVGDEDQALYRFIGAVPEDFRHLDKDWSNVLSQSYRVPKAVHEYAMRLIGQIAERDRVEYQPTEEDGSVFQTFFPKLSLTGSHMILTRCNYHLKRWVEHLIRTGKVWHNPYRSGVKAWNPTTTKLWTAIRTYDRIKSGIEVKGSDITEMIGKMNTEMLERGIKTNRKKIINQDIGPERFVDVFRLSSLPYFKADFFNFTTDISKIFPLSGQAGDLIKWHGPEITRQEPNVVLGTIHSVKGAEADHVWVDQSTSASIEMANLDDENHLDDEIRVAYVAATRARRTLGLLYPQGPQGRCWI